MIQFFPSNANQAAVAQTIYGGQSAEAIARIRAEETKAIARAQMAQQQQEGFWRQQQAQQQDALAREQLKNTDFFNRGRLTNEQAQIAATLEANKSRDAATAEWRAAQLAPQLGKIAEAKAAEAQDTAMLGAQLGNLAKVRNEYDRLTADLSKLTAMETAQTEQMKLPKAPGTFSRGFWGTGMGGLMSRKDKPYAQPATRADGTEIGGINFEGAKGRMQQQLAQLADIIKSNQELTSLLAKAPDGSWVPALPGAMPAPQAAPFFNAPAPAMTNAPAVAPPMTNAPVRYFNSAGVMPPPPPVGAIVRQNGLAYRFDGANYIPVQ